LGSELADQLFLVSEPLPSLHNHVDTIKFNDRTSLALPHIFVELIEPSVEEPLLFKDLDLMEIDLEQLLFEVPRAKRGESFFENVQAESAAADPCRFRFESVYLQPFETGSHNVETIFIVLEVGLLLNSLP